MTPKIRSAVEAAIGRQGIKRKWVAEQAGVSYPQFSRMMSGSSDGSVKTWLKMFDALGLTLLTIADLTPKDPAATPESDHDAD